MSAPATDLAELVAGHDVLICCGPGGVGKTTVAAALAMAAARGGRRAVVVTIDPARRLADAMGIEAIGHDGHRVADVGPGELWATMLDTKATFDSLIVRYAADEAQAERILTNRYYRNLSSTLSGTREYMAMETLYALHSDAEFDLVVVDTPPSRNALEFLAAPDRLSRFLDSRLFRMAVPGRRVARAVTAPMLLFLRRIARVVSPEVVDDTLAFIEAFAGMEEGFRERAAQVDRLLTSDRTGFVIVTSPGEAAVEESSYFAGELATAGAPVAALVVNRLHPRPPGDTSWLFDGSEPAAEQLPVVAAAKELVQLADAEEAVVAPLVDRSPGAVVVRVPMLHSDVHDLDGIAEIAGHLFAAQGSPQDTAQDT